MRTFGLGCLLLSTLFTAFLLVPELLSTAPPVNDHVFHEQNLLRAADALANLRDPTDVWQPWVGQGYPVFHYYQHAPYIVPAAVSQITGLSLTTTFKSTNFLLLCLFPLAVYAASRRFGFSGLSAGLSALLAPALSTDGLFGFDFASYIWVGHGLYTQLWGMVLLPLALSEGFRAIIHGKSYLRAALLVAATALSHLAFGYIALVSLVAFALLEPRRAGLPRRVRRLALIFGSVALTTAYFWLPLFLDRGYLNRSVWESAVKYDSFGAPTVLGWLVRGQLFDHGRLPVVTVLVATGILVCAARWRDARFRVPAVLFGLWLALYFGRPVWGPLLDLTPLSGDFFLHRLIGGVHIAGILLAGTGLSAAVTWLVRWRSLQGGLAVVGIVALLMLPIYAERITYLRLNDSLMARTASALAAEQPELDDLFRTLDDLPPGRVYAGLAGQWGASYLVGDVPMYALLAAEGYDTLRLYHSWSLAGDVAALFDELRVGEYDLFNVRYVVAPADRAFPDFVHPIAAFGRHVLYEVATSGYFGLVDAQVALIGDKSSFFAAASAWLGTSAVEAREHPSVYFDADRIPAGMPRIPIESADYYFATGPTIRPTAGTVEDQESSLDAFRANVVANRPAALMLRVTYHPGWRAWVDGAASRTVMLLPGYVGVPLDAGVHRVELRYGATDLRHALMLVGTAGIALLGFATSHRRDHGNVLSSRLPTAALPRLWRPLGHTPRGSLGPLGRSSVKGLYYPEPFKHGDIEWESDLPHEALELEVE